MGAEAEEADEDERRAGAILQQILGGKVLHVDPGGGSTQLHDLELILANGERIGVEVTRHTAADAEQVLGEVKKRDWQSAELGFAWVVDMHGPFRVGRAFDALPGLLRTLEEAGVTSLNLRSALLPEELFPDDTCDPDETRERLKLQSDGVRAAAEQLAELGAALVYALPADGDGGVIISQAPISGATAPEVVAELVEYRSSLPDNVVKLDRLSHLAERHLFIWVRSNEHQAVAAMAFSSSLGDSALPTEKPELPPCIDAVWVATAYSSSRVWRYHRLHGWDDFGTWMGGD